MVTTQRSWYLLKSKPRQDDLAHQNLLNQDYEIYRPMASRSRSRRQKIIVREESLFPGYMFIHLDGINDNWGPIRNTYGVDKLVRFGLEQLPPPIPDWVIDDLHKRKAKFDENVYKADHFQPGDKVVVTEGTYHGLEGVFHCYEGEQRSIILLDFLHKITKLPVSPAMLRAAA
jgi:transcriptional antiterminator RfaH